MQPQQPNVPDLSVSRVLGLALLLARALAVSVEVFLHRAGTFGERYLGLQAALAFVVMLIAPVFFPMGDPGPLYFFCALYFLRCMVVRAATLKRRLSGGPLLHSYYNGCPALLLTRSRVPEEKFKASVEPFLVGVTGLALSEWNEPLGAYLLLAGLSLFVNAWLSLRQEHERALDVNDAFLDQRRMADRWRGMRR